MIVSADMFPINVAVKALPSPAAAGWDGNGSTQSFPKVADKKETQKLDLHYYLH